MKSAQGRSGPGKSAPRLIADLLDYDPRFRNINPRNNDSILEVPAERFVGREIVRTGPMDCHHQLMRKDSQTCHLPQDIKIKAGAVLYSGSYCVNCKQHFTVTAHYGDSEQCCSLDNTANPLHHLLSTGARQIPQESRIDGNGYCTDNVVEVYEYQCSGEACGLRVEIRVGESRLYHQYFSAILDTAKMIARGQKQIDAEPARYQGSTPVRPLQALTYLWKYIKNAKASSEILETPKKIAQRNKKFQLAFGDDAGPLLKYLGFQEVSEIPEGSEDDNKPVYFWQPPIITKQNANFYEDILCELESKIRDRPQLEREFEDFSVRMERKSALPDLEVLLGCVHRMKRSRHVDLTIPEHPHYASLGAIDDFIDDHVVWAYDRQCLVDPANKPYYFDCLKGVAKGRESEDLDTKVAIAVSAGEVGQDEIDAAYRYFGLDSVFDEGDHHIAGLYKSRIESAPRQKDEAREQLAVLAKSRDSMILDELVNDKTLTYQEAMKFLNVTAFTDADTVVAQATVLAIDGDKSKVASALRAIASQRNDYLFHAKIAELEEADQPLLTLDEAYKRLQITTRNVPDTTVYTYYSSLSSGAGAGSKDSFAQALRVIALERESKYLLQKLENPTADITPEQMQSPEEPIGLNNIGNTCYLNSLLQYFYTIKPLRDVALNLDEYRLDISDGSSSGRRAGGRHNTRQEIQKGQLFTKELSQLFENLKTAPTRAIRPTVQLADLSFFNEEVEANIRRASIASPSGPPKNLFGPDGPALASPPGLAHRPILEDVEMEDRPIEKNSETASNASEATLVDMDSPQTLPAADQDLDLENMKEEPVVAVVRPDTDAAVNDNEAKKDVVAFSPPPEKPPPIPPRNKNGLSLSTPKTDKVVPNNDRWQFGTQQDVDEVIRNTTWRLMCAIKPTGTDSVSGEQSDKIRDTFYGDTATYLVKSSKIERKVESWSSLLVYASEKKAIDIYEAIDLTLDKQLVEVDQKMVPQFSSITKLPPILQIQINRTVYDKIKKQSVKVKGAVNFPETIFLDRYMDSAETNSPLMQRREEGWRMKAELQKMESRVETLQNSSSPQTIDTLPANRNKNESGSLSVTESLNNTKDFITSLQEAGITDLDIDEDLTSLLDERISEIGLELEGLQQRIDTLKRKLAEQFTDMRQYEYKLQAVFIHRGTAGAGHYWIYIYDFKNDIWREYNDERVEVVNNRKRIFDSQEQEGATPYYLVYVRASDREELVEPVCREPKAPEEVVELKDVEMNDMGDWEDVNESDDLINMEDVNEVAHVEHVKPKPLRPKAPVNQWEQKIGENQVKDGNGDPW